MPKEEQRNDSWQRFEAAVDAAIKSGPKHRTPKPKKPKRPRRASSSKSKP